MKCCKWVLAGTAASMLASVAYAQLPDSKILTLDVARAIGEAAMDQCHTTNYDVTVLVVDALNQPVFMLRDDGAPPITAIEARMTAGMAMIYNMPSRPGPEAAAGGVSQSFVPGTMKARGALPIKVGKATIGAVAVAGAPSREDDVACAKAALAKVADRLK